MEHPHATDRILFVECRPDAGVSAALFEVSPHEPACCKAVFVRPAALQANIDLAACSIQLRPMFALPAGKNGFPGRRFHEGYPSSIGSFSPKPAFARSVLH